MRITLISLLFLFLICSCNDSENEDVFLEIELVSPVAEQGEIVDIPINMPIKFQAKNSRLRKFLIQNHPLKLIGFPNPEIVFYFWQTQRKLMSMGFIIKGFVLFSE